MYNGEELSRRIPVTEKTYMMAHIGYHHWQILIAVWYLRYKLFAPENSHTYEALHPAQAC